LGTPVPVESLWVRSIVSYPWGFIIYTKNMQKAVTEARGNAYILVVSMVTKYNIWDQFVLTCIHNFYIIFHDWLKVGS